MANPANFSIMIEIPADYLNPNHPIEDKNSKIFIVSKKPKTIKRLCYNTLLTNLCLSTIEMTNSHKTKGPFFNISTLLLKNQMLCYMCVKMYPNVC